MTLPTTIVTKRLCHCQQQKQVWKSKPIHLGGPGAGECMTCTGFLRNPNATMYSRTRGVGVWAEPAKGATK